MSGSRRTAGWGRFPTVEAEVVRARTVADVAAAVASARGTGGLVARGLGRSYGDSSLGPRMLDLRGLDHLLAFDAVAGVVRCEAGVPLGDVLATVLPHGWFLPVSPGTRHVTVGGAVASDVHGKNHHRDGSFTDHVSEISVMLASGDVVTASREQHPDLFHATCGGMGLTGVVLEATFSLRPVASALVDETVVKAPDLDAALTAFAEHGSATYSVAWIDLLATGDRSGRSLVMLGEHATDGGLASADGEVRARIPIDAPGALLNRASVAAFNTLYYHRVRHSPWHHRVGYGSFFHPLDAISSWNRLYGRAGFLQYQFVLPEPAGTQPLRALIRQITASGLASPLAVLKLFGAGNQNLLSFPTAGWTLAVDLKASEQALALCDRLDALVLAAGGRLYLAKDSRMPSEMLRGGYPRVDEFEQVRRDYGAVGTFSSSQSRRLGLA